MNACICVYMNMCIYLYAPRRGRPRHPPRKCRTTKPQRLGINAHTKRSASCQQRTRKCHAWCQCTRKRNAWRQCTRKRNAWRHRTRKRSGSGTHRGVPPPLSPLSLRGHLLHLPAATPSLSPSLSLPPSLSLSLSHLREVVRVTHGRLVAHRVLVRVRVLPTALRHFLP